MFARTLSFWAALAVLVLGLAGARAARAIEVPELTGRVVDRAELLAPDEESRVVALLEAHEKATGQQFAVLTLKTLDGDPIESFSIRVVEKWQLGKKGKDDGLLLLVVPAERKMRIEVGYGLEGDVPDAFAARVVRNVLAPAFRDGNYATGIERGLRALMEAASGKAPAQPDSGARPAAPDRGPGLPSVLLALVFFGIFALPALLGFGGRRRGGRHGWYGGGWYGGGGGFSSGGGGFGGGGGFSGGGGGFGGGGSSGSW